MLPRLRDPHPGVWQLPKRLVTPDYTDPCRLVLLLRQASDSMECALIEQLIPVLGVALGTPGARTLDDVYVLRWLARRPSSPTMLAELLGRRLSTVSQRVERLVTQGLVLHDGNRDGRSFTARLNSEGRALVRSIDEVFEQLAHVWSEDVAEASGLDTAAFGLVLARMAQVA